MKQLITLNLVAIFVANLSLFGTHDVTVADNAGNQAARSAASVENVLPGATVGRSLTLEHGRVSVADATLGNDNGQLAAEFRGKIELALHSPEAIRAGF